MSNLEGASLKAMELVIDMNFAFLRVVATS